MLNQSTKSVQQHLEKCLGLAPGKYLDREDLLKLKSENNDVIQKIKEENLKEERVDRSRLIQDPNSDDKLTIAALKWMTQKGTYEDIDVLFAARQNRQLSQEALALIAYAIKCISDRDIEERAEGRTAEIEKVITPLADEPDLDRQQRIERIRTYAIEVFENDKVSADKWLRTSRSELGEMTPYDFLVTPRGAEIIEEMLGRIDYGVYH
jgi:putative toxin-antitoxin system antitoxin component (TIGR02293 family)